MIRRPTRPRSTRSILLTSFLVGGTATFAVAEATGMPASEAAELSGIAAGAAILATVVGAFVLHRLRRRTFATQIGVAALVVLFAVVVGVWAAARAMFVTNHGMRALAVILVAASAVAVVSAWLAGRRIGGAIDVLLGDIRSFGDRAPVLDEPAEQFPAELSRVRAEIASTTARLEESRQRERALDASRRELIAWVSHDLRTPLAGIRALAEALEDRVVHDADTVARYHTALRTESERLNELIDDLFELSRAQAGVLRLHFERVSLGDLVSDALATAAPVAAAKGVHLEGRIVDPAPQLFASTPELLRALRNILENAVRYTPCDGTVTVEVGMRDDSAYVTIADTGGGIPSGDLPHIFEVAFRGQEARTPGNGAGLGLAIARGFIEAHRGHVKVCNQHGGAHFTVNLPIE
jgi:signal transduction histidine kinase